MEDCVLQSESGALEALPRGRAKARVLRHILRSVCPPSSSEFEKRVTPVTDEEEGDGTRVASIFSFFFSDI